MSPLHTIQSPAALESCLARAGDGDALLLLEDSVYCALTSHPEAGALAGRIVYVLTPDLAARGLDPGLLAAGISPVDMAGFVTLTVAHSPIVGWF